MVKKIPDGFSDSKFGVQLVDFHGLPLCISRKHKSTGEIRKIKVSYRPLPEETRRKKEYGKKLLEREYNLAAKSPIFDYSENLWEVIFATLEDIMPKYFLPILFDHFPSLMTTDLSVAVALPYAWHAEKKTTKYAASTLEDKERAFRKLMALYSNKSIAYLTPENVKPDLDDVANTSKKTAEDCVTLLTQLFAGALLPFAPTYSKMWENAMGMKYAHLYSPEVQVLNRLHPPVLTTQQCRELMQRCERGIEHSRHPLRYFMAALMFVARIDVDEACAVSLSCFSQMPGDSARHYLTVFKKVIMQGDNSEKASNRVRKQRHTIALIDDATKIRNVAMGLWIDKLFLSIAELNPDPTLPLLRDSRNRGRFLHPSDFQDWLDAEFGDLIAATDSADGNERYYHRFADYLLHTAPSELKDFGCMYEELRHIEGRPPQHTDVIYYANLNHSSELEKLANIQDLWLANIFPLATKSSTDTNVIEIPGQPQHIPYGKVRIAIPPGTSKEIIIHLLSKFGGKASISYTPYPQGEHNLSTADDISLL